MGRHLAQCRDNNTRVRHAPRTPPGARTGDINGAVTTNRHEPGGGPASEQAGRPGDARRWLGRLSEPTLAPRWHRPGTGQGGDAMSAPEPAAPRATPLRAVHESLGATM